MKRLCIKAAISAAVLLTSAGTQAGGLWLNEYGDPSGGRASAGTQAGVDDASAALHNPASMTRLDGSHMLVSVGYLAPTTEFDVESSTPQVGTDDGGSAGEATPAGSLFYVNDFGLERWQTGVSFAALSGAGLDYNDDWVGRFQVQEVNILLVALAPSVAYEVTDKFSVGASVQLWYTELDMDIGVPKLIPTSPFPEGQASVDGDDYDVGYTLSALYQFQPGTRLGILYQSEIDADYSGDLELSRLDLEVDANLELPLSEIVRVGFHHDLNEQWGLDVTVGWDNWSYFDEVLINTDAAGGAISQGWEDSWKLAVGGQYQYSPQWAFTAGISYDSSPTDKDRRTPDLNVDEQIRYAVGASYTMANDVVISGYFNYADLGDAEIRNDEYTGDYSDNSLLSLSVSAHWKFGD